MIEKSAWRRIERPDDTEAERTPLRPRVERIDPELASVGTAIRSRVERMEPELDRAPSPRVAVSPAVSLRPVARGSAIGEILRSRTTLRQAILLQEILSPPKALQQEVDR